MTHTIGIEIELGILDKQKNKPVEKSFEKAFAAFCWFKTEKILARKKFFGALSQSEKDYLLALKRIKNKIQQKKAVKLEKEFSRLIKLDDLELVNETVFLRGLLNKNFLSASNTKALLTSAHGIFAMKKTLSDFEKNLEQKILLEMAFFKVLPIVHELQKVLSEKERNLVKFDESDAIEFVSHPKNSLKEAEKELFPRMLHVQDILEKKGLFLFFGQHYPKTKMLGLLERFGFGEDQNFLGLHLHLGSFEDKKQTAEYYNRIVDFFEANHEIVERDRWVFYGLKNPGRIAIAENSFGLEKELFLRFGKNAKFERSGRPNVEKIVSFSGGKKSGLALRDYSTVFFRPEFGTIEVRAFGTKGNAKDSLPKNLHANIAFLEKFLQKIIQKN